LSAACGLRRLNRCPWRAAFAGFANVWVHATASTAVVTLSFLGTEVAMDIYDDGVGFRPEAAEAGENPARKDGSGHGLRSLRERVTALAGTLDIESAPGEGTVVAIRLPLLEPASAAEEPNSGEPQGREPAGGKPVSGEPQ
jgi:signal transduction histidine kinase